MIWDYCIVLYSNTGAGTGIGWTTERRASQNDMRKLISFWIHGVFLFARIARTMKYVLSGFCSERTFLFEKIFLILVVIPEKSVEYRLGGVKNCAFSMSVFVHFHLAFTAEKNFLKILCIISEKSVEYRVGGVNRKLRQLNMAIFGEIQKILICDLIFGCFRCLI